MWSVGEGFVEAGLCEGEGEGGEFAWEELEDFVGWGRWEED